MAGNEKSGGFQRMMGEQMVDHLWIDVKTGAFQEIMVSKRTPSPQRKAKETLPQNKTPIAGIKERRTSRKSKKCPKSKTNNKQSYPSMPKDKPEVKQEELGHSSNCLFCSALTELPGPSRQHLRHQAALVGMPSELHENLGSWL